MAVLACGLDDRPLPAPADADVTALLPSSGDLALVAIDEKEDRLGAAWCHFHEPPLMRDGCGEILPEVTMAVHEDVRGRGIGASLLQALAEEAAGRYDALTVNVHLRNPAARLYMRNGFKVAGKGRGWYGVAMLCLLRDHP